MTKLWMLALLALPLSPLYAQHGPAFGGTSSGGGTSAGGSTTVDNSVSKRVGGNTGQWRHRLRCERRGQGVHLLFIGVRHRPLKAGDQVLPRSHQGCANLHILR